MRRAGLLLALDQHLDGDRRPGGARRGQVRPEAETVEQYLALVVGSTASKQHAVALGGLKRGAVPLLKRLDGLHIVVAVDEGHRCRRVTGSPLGKYRRWPSRAVRVRWPDLYHVEARFLEMVLQPVGRTADVVVAPRVG